MSKPNLHDFLLAAFACWAGVVTLFLWFIGSDDQAFGDYYANAGIQWIYLGALAANIAAANLVLSWRRVPISASTRLTLLILLSAIGAALTWMELWFGSTFYYGEVRDKQGLPYQVNSGGPFGSFVFLTYLIWRVPLGRLWEGPALVLRAAAMFSLFHLHRLMLSALAEPWLLFWQP